MKLVVVTVNYRCADAILDGIEETISQLMKLGDSEFWIVDNNSPDASADTLAEAISKNDWGSIVKLIRSPDNNGFGAGNNVAINAALQADRKPEYLYFLNPDAIPHKGAIENLVAFMDETPTAAIAGGLICNENGDPEASAFRFPSIWSEVETAINFGPVYRLLKNYVLPLPEPQNVQSVDWVSGASFIARSSVIRDLGGFDEAFFLYWEEVELCHRIKSAGHEIFVIPDAKISHIGGVSTGMSEEDKRIPEYWFASRTYLFKNSGIVGNLFICNLLVSIGLLLQRVLQTLRWKKYQKPHYFKDFVKFNFFKKAKARPE